MFNAVERLLAPQLLTDLNAERIGLFQAKLREDGLRGEHNRKLFLAHLRSALKWPADMGILAIGANDVQASVRRNRK